MLKNRLVDIKGINKNYTVRCVGMDYGENYTRLSYETALIAFVKKDKSIRIMLGTRNIKTAALAHGNMGGLLNGHDKRCNIKNGNMAVVDMALGECRAFNVDRVLKIHYFGEILTEERLVEVYKEFKDIKQQFETEMANLSLDTM